MKTHTMLFKRLFQNDKVSYEIDSQINDYAKSEDLEIVQVSLVAHYMSVQLSALVIFKQKEVLK